LAEAESALAAAERTTPALLMLADDYISQNRGADARRVLDRLSRTDDGFIAARIRQARLDFAEGPRGAVAAQRALDGVLTREPRNLDALLFKARFLLAAGDAARAVQAAENVVGTAPRSAEARSVLADAYTSRSDFAAAFRSLDEALHLNPAMVSAKVRLSSLHLRRRDLAAAVRLADEAVQDAPRSVAARLARARAATAAGTLADAASDLDLSPKGAAGGGAAAAGVQRRRGAG
jgi:tetratricopeptide (TPR) repeat protein